MDATDLQTWMGADKTEAIAALLALGGVTANQDLVARQFDRFRTLLTQRYAGQPAGCPAWS